MPTTETRRDRAELDARARRPRRPRGRAADGAAAGAADLERRLAEAGGHRHRPVPLAVVVWSGWKPEYVLPGPDGGLPTALG